MEDGCEEASIIVSASVCWKDQLGRWRESPLGRPSGGLSPTQHLLREPVGETVRPCHFRAYIGLAWALDTYFPCQGFGEPWPGMARLLLRVEGNASLPSSIWRGMRASVECYHYFLSFCLVFSRQQWLPGFSVKDEPMCLVLNSTKTSKQVN